MMRLKKKSKNKKKLWNKKILFFVLLPLLCIGISLFALNQQNIFKTNAQQGRIIVLFPNPDVARPNLQLRTFPFITIPPQTSSQTPVSTNAPQTPQTPQTTRAPMIPAIGGYCPIDDLKPANNSCSCIDSNAIACPAPPVTVGAAKCPQGQIPFQLPIASGIWYCVTIGQPGMIEPNPPAPPEGCYAACIAKPIVYLYPTKKTLVDVSVTAPGEVFISDPLYPEGGWKNVEAHPDGTLYYQGKKYSELFYETNVTEKIPMPETGYIIPRAQLEPRLREYITKIGLQGRETEEFLEYWVPVLEGLNTPYVFFSILPPDVKESVDALTVVPEPDTRIEFIAYFKPLNKPIATKPLRLPDTPPERIGFTEVEWGGTIIRD